MIDWILGVGSMAQLYLMTNKWKYAGYVGLFVQVFWAYFSYTTQNYGLLISCVGFTFMHSRTVWKWHLKEWLECR